MELTSRAMAAMSVAKRFKHIYVAIMLWVVGRALQAAARVDHDIGQIFERMPPGFAFCLAVWPDGPAMAVKRDANGRAKQFSPRKFDLNQGLHLQIKSLEVAFAMFTFRESTAAATCNDRIVVAGDVPAAMAMVRALDAVEVYLLPKFLACLAVKRYPDWPMKRKLIGRLLIFLRGVIGW